MIHELYLIVLQLLRVEIICMLCIQFVYVFLCDIRNSAPEVKRR